MGFHGYNWNIQYLCIIYILYIIIYIIYNIYNIYICVCVCLMGISVEIHGMNLEERTVTKLTILGGIMAGPRPCASVSSSMAGWKFLH